jgi:hypothetical protein
MPPAVPGPSILGYPTAHFLLYLLHPCLLPLYPHCQSNHRPAVHLREEWGDEVRQTCNWAAASCAVVAASPLIGKVAQLSYERTLGTLTGGLLGYLVSQSDQPLDREAVQNDTNVARLPALATG